MTTEVHPGLELGSQFTDECADDPDGKKVYTKLRKEIIWQMEHLIREGYARDMADLLRKMATDWLDIKGPLISSDGDYDATRRSWQMQQQMRFMLDRGHDVEHMPAIIQAGMSELFRDCDHRKLAEQVVRLWNQAQAGDEYWRRKYTALFRDTAVLSKSVAVLHRVGWPLPGDLVSYVLGGTTHDPSSGAPGSELDRGAGADPGHDPGDMEGEP